MKRFVSYFVLVATVVLFAISATACTAPEARLSSDDVQTALGSSEDILYVSAACSHLGERGIYENKKNIDDILAPFRTLAYKRIDKNAEVRTLFCSNQSRKTEYRIKIKYNNGINSEIAVCADGSVLVNCNDEFYLKAPDGSVKVEDYYNDSDLENQRFSLEVYSADKSVQKALGQKNASINNLVVHGSPYSSYLGYYNTQTEVEQFVEALRDVSFEQSDFEGKTLFSAETSQYYIDAYLSDGTQTSILILSDGSVQLAYINKLYSAPAGSVDWDYYLGLQRQI